MTVPRLDSSISVGGARRALARMFAAAGLDTPALDARVIVGHALGLDHAALTGAAEHALGAQERERIAAMAARRLDREPVARIVGMKEFWGLSLRVSPAVLVPRPRHAGSRSASGLSPHPPSGFCLDLSHSTARWINCCFMSYPMARKPDSAEKVP